MLSVGSRVGWVECVENVGLILSFFSIIEANRNQWSFETLSC